MKFRTGFVSNSSSSSFVIMMTKDAYNKAFNEAHPYVQAVIKELGHEESKFDGKDVITMGRMSIQDYGTFDEFYPDYDGEIPDSKWMDKMDPSKAFDTFLESIPDDKQVTHSEDM